MDNKVTTAVNGIKSKARVQKHGEVFTPDSIVCDMHDGVTRNLFSEYKEDYEKKQLQPVLSLDDYIRDTYIAETYLEPTCGDGQFLIRILDEKLKYVNKVPVEQRELALVKAVSTIYGIDIQADNVAEARARLERYLFDGQVETFDVGGKQVEREFTVVEGVNFTDKLRNVIKNIIHNNIIVGNMLETEDIPGDGINMYETMIPRILGYEFREDGTVLVEICKLTDMSVEDDENITCETVGVYNYLNIPSVRQYSMDTALTYTTVDECESAYEKLIIKEKADKEARIKADEEKEKAEREAKKARKAAEKAAAKQRAAEENSPENLMDDNDF